MTGEAATDRRVMALSGADALPFLQGLVSNDVLCLGCLLYTSDAADE